MRCVTLLSDFGLMDASVATVKGILFQYTAGTPVIDISHLLEPYHLPQAAYILAAAFKNFPAGTVHVILFDIFSAPLPRLILAKQDEFYFLAPDNGVLPLALEPGYKAWQCFELKPEMNFREWIRQTGKAIRGLKQEDGYEHSLEPVEAMPPPRSWQPVIRENHIECHVIHIDRYENVVLNLTRKIFDEVGRGRNFSIEFMRDEEIREISSNYNSVKEGEKLCRFNDSGYLELAINRGKAASLFGLRLYQNHHLMYNTIKIFFK